MSFIVENCSLCRISDFFFQILSITKKHKDSLSAALRFWLVPSALSGHSAQTSRDTSSQLVDYVIPVYDVTLKWRWLLTRTSSSCDLQHGWFLAGNRNILRMLRHKSFNLAGIMTITPKSSDVHLKKINNCRVLLRKGSDGFLPYKVLNSDL